MDTINKLKYLRKMLDKINQDKFPESIEELDMALKTITELSCISNARENIVEILNSEYAATIRRIEDKEE